MVDAQFIMDGPPHKGSRRGPTQPTLIPTGYARCIAFADLDALGRHIHRARRGRGLRLTSGHATCGSSDTFPILKVWWQREFEAGGEDYAFAVAIQSHRREPLEAALARTNPDQPEGFK